MSVRMRIGLVALASALGLALAGCDRRKQDGHDDHGHEGHGHDEAAEARHEEGVVRLTQEQLEAAKITVSPVSSGVVSTVLRLTAVVAPNQDAQVHATPKVSGVVRTIHKRLGDAVSTGDPLCDIESVELGQAASEYLKTKTMLEAQREILAQETRILDQSVELAMTIHERERQLKEQQISLARALFEAERDLARARLERDRRLLEVGAAVRQLEVELLASHERLRILGVRNEEIERISANDGAGIGIYTIRAAGPGVITARHVSLNEFVGTERTLFEIHDLSKVWVQANVYEKDLRSVRTGQAACVKLDAFPGVCMDAKVTLVGFALDPRSRAATVRIELDDPRVPGWPEPYPVRPGMFGAAELTVGSRQALLTLPEAAVVHEGQEHYVFVRVDATTFRRQPVHVAEGAGGIVEVVEGLKAGDEVAVEGTFTLKSMARAEELGGGHSH